MAINNIGSGNHPGLITEGNRQQGVTNDNSPAQTQPSAPVAGAPGDRVSFTGIAGQLRQLEEQVSTLPVVDTDKVSAVRHELATGAFQVNPQRVADKMIEIEGMISQKLG